MFSLLKLLEKSQPEIKEYLKDEAMCECVKDTVDDIIDEIWLLGSFWAKIGEKFDLRPTGKHQIPIPEIKPANYETDGQANHESKAWQILIQDFFVPNVIVPDVGPEICFEITTFWIYNLW